jgi:hypothetical protein
MCYNCDCKGHYKADCWRPGGGKEGQGPKQQQWKGGNSQRQTASTATESEAEITMFSPRQTWPALQRN